MNCKYVIMNTEFTKNIRVLIAEDSDVNRMVVKKHIEKIGFQYFFVENGQECINTLKENQFDIILMDMQMPVMDGFQATEYIRSQFNDEKKSIPIISMTADVSSEAVESYKKAGVNEVLKKPFNTEELKFKIISVLNSVSVVSSENNEIKENNSSEYQYIDLTYLRDMADGDESFIENMIQVFVDMTPEVLQNLQNATNDKNWAEVRAITHKFSPQLNFVGVKSIIPTVENVEQWSKNNENTEIIPEKVTVIIETTQKAILELTKVLESYKQKN